MNKRIDGILIANNYLTKCKLENSHNVELARKLLLFKVREALEAIKIANTQKTKN